MLADFAGAGIAAAHHRIDIGGVLAAAWVGAMAGGMGGWLIGHKAGRPLMTAPGPLRRLRLRLLAHGDDVYSRRGLLAGSARHSRSTRRIKKDAAAIRAWDTLNTNQCTYSLIDDCVLDKLGTSAKKTRGGKTRPAPLP